jgi:hypothetical protein
MRPRTHFYHLTVWAYLPERPSLKAEPLGEPARVKFDRLARSISRAPSSRLAVSAWLCLASISMIRAFSAG